MRFSFFSNFLLFNTERKHLKLSSRFSVLFLAFLSINILMNEWEKRYQMSIIDKTANQIALSISPYAANNQLNILQAIGKSETKRNAQIKAISIDLNKSIRPININSGSQIIDLKLNHDSYQSTATLFFNGEKLGRITVESMLTQQTQPIIAINILVMALIAIYLTIQRKIKCKLISDQKKIAKSSLYLAMDACSDGWWELNKDNKTAIVSKRLCNLLSIDHNDKTQPCVELKDNWWVNYFEQSVELTDFLNQKEFSATSKEVKIIQRSNKNLRHLLINRIDLAEYKYIPKSTFFIIKNISNQVATRNRIEDMAFTDKLTNLSNRVSFEIEIEKLSAEKSRYQYRYCLLMLDIDNFKHLNDTNGHLIGDQFLREISNRLRLILRPMDFIGRIGGDEFVIIAQFPNGDDADIMRRCLAIGEKVQREISRPFIVNNLSLQYNCSIGICIDKDQSESPMSMLDYADLALYNSKDNGRNKISFFQSSMKDIVTRRASLKEMIDRALESKTIYVHYQPIFDISLQKKGRKRLTVIGYEALFRCDYINASPGLIIKTAEKTGQVVQITKAVINAIGNDIKNNKFKLTSSQKISINVSAIEILNPLFSKQLLGYLEQNNINHQQVFIELTETSFISNIEIAKQNIDELREKGIQFAMDDFGSGYASIQTLRDIEFDRIKIDKSYIKGPMNDLNLALIKALIWTARAINVDLVAEGIETEEQLTILGSLGCSLGQGFYLDQFQDQSTNTKC